jgi:AraC-like DNA-binding protein
MACLVRSLELELRPPAVAHVSIFDARRLEGADLKAFGIMSAYVCAHSSGLATWVRHQALVRPEGLQGAVVSGFYEVLPKPYPVQIFAEASAALAWLSQHEDIGADPASVARALDDAFVEVTKTSPLLLGLRAYVEAHLTEDVAVGAAARFLGVSERTLQRRLAETSTSFVEEVAQARVRVAQRLLLDSGAPLTTIALDVGCGSLQHFSALFRRITGSSPSAWRESHKVPT